MAATIEDITRSLDDILALARAGPAALGLEDLRVALRHAGAGRFADNGIDLLPMAAEFGKRAAPASRAASALIKSVRGSDPDAAVYWIARMLDAGEDPRFIARRLVILAEHRDPEPLGIEPQALEATPLVVDGVTYTSGQPGTVVALALTIGRNYRKAIRLEAQRYC